MAAPASSWAYTVSRESQPDDDSLIICCLSLSQLGIDGLAEEVGELCGDREAYRWHRARAEEYAKRLFEALRSHLRTAELVVHVDDAEELDKVRVVVGEKDAPDPASRRDELIDRVDAIRRRTWLTWWQGLQLTMIALRRLDKSIEDSTPAAGAEKSL